MKLLKLNEPNDLLSNASEKACLLFGLLLLLWICLQRFIAFNDPTAGMLDPNIWLLLLFSLICFLVLLGLCLWLLRIFQHALGLPGLNQLISQFKTLDSWQQLKLYWASFALLLLAAVGILNVVL